LLAVPKLHTEDGNLYLQAGTTRRAVAVPGEVLWGEELPCVQEFTRLPRATKAFCREGADRLAHGDYVGAGDAFAAAFMHGLISEWPAGEGAILAWTLEEAVAL
jgi:hypothetical protein